MKAYLGRTGWVLPLPTAYTFDDSIFTFLFLFFFPVSEICHHLNILLQVVLVSQLHPPLWFFGSFAPELPGVSGLRNHARKADALLWLMRVRAKMC